LEGKTDRLCVDRWDICVRRRIEVSAENWKNGIPTNCNGEDFVGQDSVSEHGFLRCLLDMK